MKLFYRFFIATLVLDLATKYVTISALKPFRSISLIGTFLQFTYVQNRGAAFSILHGQQLFLIAVSIIVASAIIWFLCTERPRERLVQSGLGLLLGGTLGNLYDRVVHGFVVDFIDFNFFATFNIADMAINVGVALLIWQALRSEHLQKAHRPKRRS